MGSASIRLCPELTFGNVCSKTHFLNCVLPHVFNPLCPEAPLELLHLAAALSPVSLMECVWEWNLSKLLFVWMHWERASPAELCLAGVETRALLSMWDLWFRIMSFLEVEQLIAVWRQADRLCPGAYSCSSWSGATSHNAGLNGFISASFHSSHIMTSCPEEVSCAPESASPLHASA